MSSNPQDRPTSDEELPPDDEPRVDDTSVLPVQDEITPRIEEEVPARIPDPGDDLDQEPWLDGKSEHDADIVKKLDQETWYEEIAGTSEPADPYVDEKVENEAAAFADAAESLPPDDDSVEEALAEEREPLEAGPEAEPEKDKDAVEENVGQAEEQVGSRIDDARQEFEERAGGMVAGVRGFFDPKTHPISTDPHRLVIAVGAVLVLLSLLSNDAGLALLFLSAVVPLMLISTLVQRDLFEDESPTLIVATGLAGGVVGLVLGWLSSWVIDSNWFDRGILNYGAGGFAGRYAEADGSAPFLTWFLCGLVIPAAAIAALLAGPIALRRYSQFRNEIMDGVILAGAAGAGFAIGTAIVYWGPMIGDDGPRADVGDWTVAIIGLTVIRPVILVLCCAMIGAGVWKYMLTARPGDVLLAAIGGVGGFLLFALGSILTGSNGVWAEFIWAVFVSILVTILYRMVLKDAVAIDRRALSGESLAASTSSTTNVTAAGTGSRVVCPTCHKLTPAGTFCANCGSTLPTD